MKVIFLCKATWLCSLASIPLNFLIVETLFITYVSWFVYCSRVFMEFGVALSAGTFKLEN